MKATTEHEKYGVITYEEGFWAGKRKLSFNGQELTALDKKNFKLQNEDGTATTVTLVGNYLTGVKMQVNNETVRLLAAPAWYEWVFMAIILAFDLVWGNVKALVEIMPLVGGAIGGFIAGFLAVLYLVVARMVKNPLYKVLIFLGFLGAEIGICYGIGAVILATMA